MSFNYPFKATDLLTIHRLNNTFVYQIVCKGVITDLVEATDLSIQIHYIWIPNRVNCVNHCEGVITDLRKIWGRTRITSDVWWITKVAQEARVIVAQEAHGIKVIIIDRGTRSTSQIIITTVCKHILRDCLVQCTIYKTLTAHGYKEMCSPAGAGGRRCCGE